MSTPIAPSRRRYPLQRASRFSAPPARHITNSQLKHKIRSARGDPPGEPHPNAIGIRARHVHGAEPCSRLSDRTTWRRGRLWNRSDRRVRLRRCHHGELLVDLLPASAERGELAGSVPRSPDAGLGSGAFGPGLGSGAFGPGLGSGAFGPGGGGLSPGGGQRVWEALDLSFEARDDAAWFAALPVEGGVRDLDVSVRDGEADLVLDGGDGLVGDGESGQLSDLGHRSCRPRWGPVEHIAHESLQVLAGLDALGVAVTVDGHREAVAVRAGHPAEHGLKLGGALFSALDQVAVTKQ